MSRSTCPRNDAPDASSGRVLGVAVEPECFLAERVGATLVVVPQGPALNFRYPDVHRDFAHEGATFTLADGSAAAACSDVGLTMSIHEASLPNCC